MNKDVNNEHYQQKTIGLGSPTYRLGVYIGNFPDSPSLADLQSVRPAHEGEVVDIIAQTGNHWRKVFSLCAKINFALWPSNEACWQGCRDAELFQSDSKMALLCSSPVIPQENELQLVLGKQYCQQCFPQQPFLQTVEGFPMHPTENIIQTPYFDYRQLSNLRLEALVRTIKTRMNV